MIYLKTDDEALARELLIGFNDRAVVNVGGSAFVICDIARNLSSAGDVSVEAKGERVVTLPWNGTGNPPAGTVCEMTHSGWGDRGWERVTINYCSAEYAITTDGNGEQHWHMRNIHFRVMRTPEQIAAEEREAAIEEMYHIYKSSPGLATQQGMAALYDHGYRKQSTKQDDQQ